MTATLTVRRYRDLCALVGKALDHSRPVVREIGVACEWPVGIYLLGHRHPVTSSLVVDYVGSAVRRSSDVGDRVRDHLLIEAKRERFTSQVLLPLRSDTPLEEVRRLEGKVARFLNVPLWCKRVPGGRSAWPAARKDCYNRAASKSVQISMQSKRLTRIGRPESALPIG